MTRVGNLTPSATPAADRATGMASEAGDREGRASWALATAFPWLSVQVVYGTVALVLAAAIFHAIFHYYYNFFFNRGDGYDFNLFAYLIWHNPTFRHFSDPTVSFFKVHVAPFLLGVGYLSYLFPASQETYFSGFMALIHASFVPAFMGLWWLLIRQRVVGGAPAAFWVTGGLIVAGAGLAFAFALNGIVLKALWIGHYEFFIPILIIGLLIALSLGSTLLVGAFLALLLIQREDAGFHAFSFLFLWIAYRFLVEKQPLGALRREIIVAGICFVYPVLCFAGVSVLLGGSRPLESIWAGSPPWSHLSWARIAEVLTLHKDRNAQLYLPALVIGLAAVLKRRPAYLIGVLAPLPWLLIHLIAAHLGSAYIYTYKAFPFIVMLLWPLIIEVDAQLRLQRAGVDAQGQEGAQPTSRSIFATAGLQAAILALTIVPWAYGKAGDHGMTWANLSGPRACAQNRSTYDAFQRALPAIKERYGDIMVSPGIRRLAPTLFTPRDVAVWYRGDFPDKFAERKPLMVIFFGGDRGANAIIQEARENGLAHFQRVPESPIMIASQVRLTRLPGDAPLIAARPFFHPIYCTTDAQRHVP